MEVNVAQFIQTQKYVCAMWCFLTAVQTVLGRCVLHFGIVQPAIMRRRLNVVGSL